MPNVLKVTVENADELLNTGAYGAGAVVRVQSSATETGVFSNLSGSGSTPTIALVSGTRLHTGYDPNGTSSTWYRTRYENAGGTVTSDWATAFQVGSESAGLLCSIYDVEQRISGTPTAQDRELLLEFIRQVTRGIQSYCRQVFIRDPLSGTEVWTLDAFRSRNISPDYKTLYVPKGLAALTTVELKESTDGTFAVVPTTDWYLRPEEEDRLPGWPATSVVITDTPAASNTRTHFYEGYGVIRLTGARYFDSVPPDVAGIAENAVIRRWTAKGSGVATALGTDDFGARLLRWISPEEREMLDTYRMPSVH